MWLVIITCSGDAWKRYGTDFLALAGKYPSTIVSSKKTPDGKRFMEYQIEDVGDAEDFEQECQNLDGFTARFESL